jgi:putative membrane protein insertion efficiency factor
MSAARALIHTAIRGYQIVLSPWLGTSCRYHPTCSHYALEALETHGAARGSCLALKRIGRCHPFASAECYTCDPVPAARETP